MLDLSRFVGVTILISLITACTPSESVIQTAIAQTQAAIPKSTEVMQPTPPSTKWNLATSTPTTTPIPLYLQEPFPLTNPIYIKMEDFNESWAQLGWYEWYWTGYSPTTFIIRADSSWESASTIADTQNSGCGFVFYENGVDNHYLSYLGLDGTAYINRVLKSYTDATWHQYYNKVGYPKGSAEIALAVEEGDFYFYVNQEKVVQASDKKLTSGKLGLTLLSGTNKDFGTRCSLKNIDLWLED